MSKTFYVTTEKLQSMENCHLCKIRKYFARKWHEKLDWTWYNCPYSTDCSYAQNEKIKFDKSGFKIINNYLKVNSKGFIIQQPLENAQILTLRTVIKDYLNKNIKKGNYYLLDNNIEIEQLELNYDYLIDKFKENPKYMISFYVG